MIDPAEMLAIEERALAAWPALDGEMADGWALRAAGGCTKRANSANALSPSGPFDAARAKAEAFYAGRGLPAIFRITPLAPPEADAALAAAGYSLFDPSLVLTMKLVDGFASDGVRVEPTASPEWLAAFAEANGMPAAYRLAHDAIVRAIAGRTAFATRLEADRPVAFGFAVIERGMVGLFDIVTVPAERGRGHGRAVTGALLDWAGRAGATGSYIQVRGVNDVARNLYDSLGYRQAYAYHYRIPPARSRKPGVSGLRADLLSAEQEQPAPVQGIGQLSRDFRGERSGGLKPAVLAPIVGDNGLISMAALWSPQRSRPSLPETMLLGKA